MGVDRTLLVLAALLAAGCSAPGTRPAVRPLLDGPVVVDTAEGRRVDEATGLWRAGLYDQARAAVDRLLADGSSHPEALLLKARLLIQEDRAEAALPWLERAAAASPLWPEPRILYAQTCLALERTAAAETVFTDIDRIAPRSAWGPYGLAVMALRRGDQAEAARLADRALERDPDHQPALALRASLARAAGELAREEAVLSRLALLTPEDDQVWSRLGELAQAAGRQEDARRCWERAWGLAPRPATARLLADQAQELGDEPEAIRWRTRAGMPAASGPLTPDGTH